MLSQYDINFPIVDSEITIGQTEVKRTRIGESVLVFIELYNLLY
jgi:hypothetical protein